MLTKYSRIGGIIIIVETAVLTCQVKMTQNTYAFKICAHNLRRTKKSNRYEFFLNLRVDCHIVYEKNIFQYTRLILNNNKKKNH